MIFVTVGTHEQPFNRLIKAIDEMKENRVFSDDVVIQTGFSTYEPKFCKWSKLFSYKEMSQNIADARIVISHGGPSSFIAPLQVGKIPIVVPRQKKYEEHVNNHQVEFCDSVSERKGNIIVVEEMDELKKTIINYDSIIASMPASLQSNNAKFNLEFEHLVYEMFSERK